MLEVIENAMQATFEVPSVTQPAVVEPQAKAKKRRSEDKSKSKKRSSSSSNSKSKKRPVEEEEEEYVDQPEQEPAEEYVEPVEKPAKAPKRRKLVRLYPLTCLTAYRALPRQPRE
jgi:hypothetical protein